MTLLLYAIAAGPPPRRPLPAGVDGRPVRGLSHDDLTAYAGGCDEPPRPDHEMLLRYERTVEELMGEATLLPVRFGTMLPDEPAVREVLDRRGEELTASLDRVSGAVELGVRVQWGDQTLTPTRPAPGTGAGADYLRERLELRHRAREAADTLDLALGDLARERSRRILATSQHPLSAAYLVPRPRVAEFLARCREMRSAIAGADLVCTGPWPPYTFATSQPA